MHRSFLLQDVNKEMSEIEVICKEVEKFKNDKFPILKTCKNFSGQLTINIGGTYVKTSRKALTLIFSSNMSRIFDGTWDHIIPRDIDGFAFLDLDAKWLVPIIQALNNQLEDDTFELERFYRTTTSNEPSLYSDDVTGYFICLEYFGLEGNFRLHAQYFANVKSAMKQYLSTNPNHTSGNYDLEFRSTVFAQYPGFAKALSRPLQKDVLYVLTDMNNIVHAFLCYAISSNISNVLYMNLSCTGVITMQEGTSSYAMPRPAALGSTTSVVALQIGFPTHILYFTEIACYTANYHQIKEVITCAIPVKQSANPVISSGTDKSSIVNALENLNKQLTCDMVNLKRDVEYMNSYMKDEYIANPGEIVKIASIGGGTHMQTKRSNFLQFKDTPLVTKFTSDCWQKNLVNEMDETGCIIEKHNSECFEKLINVMRMRAIVRRPNYKGKWSSYKPAPVRDNLKPAMSRMLKYLIIDENDFFGPIGIPK